MNTNSPKSSADGVQVPNRVPFYTVAEAARLLRVNAMTIYRAIQDDAFPAVKIRARYVIPAAALEQLAAEASETGGCVDVAAIAAERRFARELAARQRR